MTLLTLNMDMSTLQKKGCQSMTQSKANSVDPDETAIYEAYHLDKDCFQSFLFWSAGLNGLVLS